MGGKRPRQSHGVSVLPDGAGVASVAERHTRETDVLRLSKTHRLEPGGSGPEAVRTRCRDLAAGNFAGGVTPLLVEAMGKVCGVPMARPQGHSRAPPPSSESQ
jgi:hypothetical protein